MVYLGIFLAKIINDLSNLLINFKKFPDLFKVAKVKSLFKKGSLNQHCNYRPISLLPLISSYWKSYSQSNKYPFEFKKFIHVPIRFLKKAFCRFLPFLFEWQNFIGLGQGFDDWHDSNWSSKGLWRSWSWHTFWGYPSYSTWYPRLLTGSDMLVFFTIWSRYLALFPLFSVIDGFGWFWMGSLYKNIQLMLEFLKAPYLVLHFSYYMLVTFLMMLSVVLLSMLMILLSTLKCDQSSDLWQQLELAFVNLNLTYETLWKWDTGAGSGFLKLKARKTELVSFYQSNNFGAIDVKVYVCFRQKIIFWDAGVDFLFWIGLGLTLSLFIKVPPRKLEPWFVL